MEPRAILHVHFEVHNIYYNEKQTVVLLNHTFAITSISVLLILFVIYLADGIVHRVLRTNCFKVGFLGKV